MAQPSWRGLLLDADRQRVVGVSGPARAHDSTGPTGIDHGCFHEHSEQVSFPQMLYMERMTHGNPAVHRA